MPPENFSLPDALNVCKSVIAVLWTNPPTTWNTHPCHLNQGCMAICSWIPKARGLGYVHKSSDAVHPLFTVVDRPP